MSSLALVRTASTDFSSVSPLPNGSARSIIVISSLPKFGFDAFLISKFYPNAHPRAHPGCQIAQRLRRLAAKLTPRLSALNQGFYPSWPSSAKMEA